MIITSAKSIKPRGKGRDLYFIKIIIICKFRYFFLDIKDLKKCIMINIYKKNINNSNLDINHFKQ